MPRKGRLIPIQDFLGILAAQESPVIGGQAVNLWAVSCEAAAPQIKRFAPYVSADCDLLGGIETLIKLKDLTGSDFTTTKPGSPTPVVGFVKTNINGKPLLIEVLHTVRGLTPAEMAKSRIAVEVDKAVIWTFSPVLLLKAKIANACEMPQDDRQDVRHIQILIPCAAVYLRRAIQRQKRI